MLAIVKNSWRVDCASGIGAMRDLKPQWLALEARDNNPYACFQGHTWCSAWAETWCHDGASYEPRIYLIYRNDELVGLLPMMVSAVSGLRILNMMGTPHTQTASFIQDADTDLSDALPLIREQILSSGVDVIAINAIPETSPLAQLLEGSTVPDPADHMAITHRGDHVNSHGYYKSISRNRKRDFSRKLRRLQDMGKLAHSTIPLGSPAFEKLAKEAIEMKRFWLKEKRTVSSGLSWQKMTDFVQRLNQTDTTYQCEVQTLTLDEKPIAISINMLGNGMRSCYLSAYDLSLGEASPGTVMHQLSIQQSIDEGLQGYNFLGHPTYFKTLWTNQKIPLLRSQMALSWKGHLWINVWANRIKPLAKKLLGRTGKSA